LIEMIGMPRVPRAVSGDPDHRDEQNNPIERVHANQREKIVSNTTTSAKNPKTNR
jgi:hypothetical protein